MRISVYVLAASPTWTMIKSRI